MTTPLSDQELLRLDRREALAEIGIPPYPSAAFSSTTTTLDILQRFPDAPEAFDQITLAGRIMSRRIMGASSFVELQDEYGKVQLYVHRDKICPEEDKTLYNTAFKKYLDIGDIIGVHGRVFTTKVGAIAVEVQKLTVLSKALSPLPVVKEIVREGERKIYDAFTDPEQRYRQRYVDLIVNPQVRKTFQQRSQLIRTMRKYMDERGYWEVETPILQPIYGGAAARPFKTHHNSLGVPLYLRIANELYLKRLIIGGYHGVYEFAKDFRNEGMSRFHNPEFTMMEVYIAYKDYRWMMDFVEGMVRQVAMDLHGTTEVQVGDERIDFQKPWKRWTMFEAIEHFTGFEISRMGEAALRKTANEMCVSISLSAGKGKIIDEIFGSRCEPHIIQPTFITDYPVEMSPLAKQHRDNPALAERFEVICNGKEICNAFSELNDPVEQRKRFEEQLALARRGDEEAMVLDEDFLQALSYGMPPTAGLGIGIDRLTMIMTNETSIQDVIFFPQMRPKDGRERSTFEM